METVLTFAGYTLGAFLANLILGYAFNRRLAAVEKTVSELPCKGHVILPHGC